MNALADELFEACKGLNPLAWERLQALGVSRAAVADAMDHTHLFPPIGVLKIEADASGYWQPCDEGRPALIQPVTIGGELGGELVDLLAWRSADPLKVYTRNGQSWALGLDHIDEVMSAWEPVPLIVHASPRDWLAAGGRGLCVTDWNAPEVADLRMVGEIAVPSPAFGKVLRDTLMRAPRLPVIRTHAERIAHAA